MKMPLWDYQLAKNWQPQSQGEWFWYLERKINYDDWQGLDPKIIKKYLPKLKIHPGKKLMLEAYFKYYESK